MNKAPTSFRLSADALDLLDQLSEKCGISKTAVIEILIRERAKKEGVQPRGNE